MIKFAVTTMFLLVSLCVFSGARAQTINTWVDEEGVTHYSDQKPAGQGSEVKEIEVPKSSVSEFESEAVNERINRQLQKLEQDRKAREQQAEEQKRAKTAEEALEREPIVVEEKKKKKDKDRDYSGPYPKPLPGPFPEQYPRQRGPGN
jgi:hypothetical protein